MFWKIIRLTVNRLVSKKHFTASLLVNIVIFKQHAASIYGFVHYVRFIPGDPKKCIPLFGVSGGTKVYFIFPKKSDYFGTKLSKILLLEKNL